MASARKPPAPSRRMTLGPVPTNRRMSVDTSEAKPTQRPPRGRQSMAPRVGRENLLPQTPQNKGITASTASSRRRSVGGDSRRQSLARVDPRPIGDKAFQQHCVKTVLRYLQEHNYEYPVSIKTLTKPSGKDFSHIVTFLMRRVDPNFQDDKTKLEDEVALNFRGLGYPYPISKTGLVAAGSPHTWPSLLAALTWLVERLQVTQPQRVDFQQEMRLDTEAYDTLEELEQQTDRFFFQYLGYSYQAFLQGDAARSEELEVMLAGKVEKDDAFLEEEIDRVTDLNANMLQRIHGLTEEVEEYVH